MLRRITLTAGVGLALSAAAQAQDSYRWEVNADYRDGEVNDIPVCFFGCRLVDADLQEFALSGS